MSAGTLVSVVIPTRNRVSMLFRAIESVRAQTLHDWELIVVDDGSEDATAERVTNLGAVDSRIRLHCSSVAAGAAVARNLGASLGRGRYIAFLDDDAEWLPEKLARQMNILEGTPQAGMAYCQLQFHDQHGRTRLIGSDSAASSKQRRALLQGNVIDTSCALLRRDVFDQVGGFDEALPRLQDWDLWLRLADVTRFLYMPEPLVRGYFTDGSISTNGPALVSACRQLSSRLEARSDIPRTELGDWFYTLGHTLMNGGEQKAGRRYLLRSIMLKPWPPQRLIITAAAAAGDGPFAFMAGLHRRTVQR